MWHWHGQIQWWTDMVSIRILHTHIAFHSCAQSAVHFMPFIIILIDKFNYFNGWKCASSISRHTHTYTQTHTWYFTIFNLQTINSTRYSLRNRKNSTLMVIHAKCILYSSSSYFLIFFVGWYHFSMWVSMCFAGNSPFTNWLRLIDFQVAVSNNIIAIIIWINWFVTYLYIRINAAAISIGNWIIIIYFLY